MEGKCEIVKQTHVHTLGILKSCQRCTEVLMHTHTRLNMVCECVRVYVVSPCQHVELKQRQKKHKSVIEEGTR